MIKPRVTFIIPHWNRRYLLEKSLPSIYAQDYRNFRIIIVDNGSEDDSVEWLGKNYPDVEIIRLTENRGYAPAANIGFRKAETDYVAFYSNDVIADSAWLSNLVRAMDANESLGFTVGKILWSETPDVIYAAGDHYGVNAFPFNVGRDEIDEGQYDEPREVLSICTAASLFRREALEKIGPYDEDYFAHGEDTDLCLRMRLGGWRGAYIPSAKAYHLGSASSNPGSREFIRRTNRNGVYTLVKDYPWPIMKRHIPELLMAFTLSLFIAKYPLSAIQGRIDAVKDLPRLLRKRKEIQKNRVCPLHEIERLMITGGGES